MGRDFPAHLADAIEDAEIVVFVSSSAAASSDWVTREIIYAAENEKEIFPIRLDDSPFNNNLRIYLPGHNYFDLFELDEHGLERFTNGLYNKLYDTKTTSKAKTVDNYLYEFKRIQDDGDPDLIELLRIYARLFDTSHNAAQEAIIKTLFGGHEYHHACLFLLKRAGVAFGFADVSYFVKEKMLYVSYIGVLTPELDGERKIYTLQIADHLLSYYKSNNMQIDEIVFDTENEKLLRFFSRVLFNKYKLKTHLIDLEFIQPRILADNTREITEETAFKLTWIPFSNSLQELAYMSKKKVLSIIRSVYWNIFLEITDGSPKKEYEQYLEGLLNKYEDKLPESIRLIHP